MCIYLPFQVSITIWPHHHLSSDENAHAASKYAVLLSIKNVVSAFSAMSLKFLAHLCLLRMSLSAMINPQAYALLKRNHGREHAQV